MINLRPVEIAITTYEGTQPIHALVKGWFHTWGHEGNEDGCDTYAICELEDGSMIKPNVINIKFLDRA